MRFAIVFSSAAVLLAGAAAAGETHIISRDSYGYFLHSHRLYDSKRQGLVAVRYCGRQYFVSPKTVAWTEHETEDGNVVGLEYGDGKAWTLICRNPQEQVRYADVQQHIVGDAVWGSHVWFAAKREGQTRSYHDGLQ